MSPVRRRPLPVGPLRAFEIVARHLNFRAAAEELSLTQSAVSRQIQSLEDDLGAALFLRGTRHVQLTTAGTLLLRTVAPLLEQLDTTVRQIRQSSGRRVVGVTTFASFASLWLIPRLEAFQRAYPDIDIRVSATDEMIEPDASEIDVALRYCVPAQAPEGAVRLFGEVLMPVASPWLKERAANGSGPRLDTLDDLAEHTLLDEFDNRLNVVHMNWRGWLGQHGLDLVPKRWLYFNYTFQQVQAALTGQGVALARLPLVAEALQSGELFEPFAGVCERIQTPHAYWLLASPASRRRPEVAQFCSWIEQQAALTRAAIDECPPEDDSLGEWD